MVQPDWNPDTPGIHGIQATDVGYGHDVVNAPASVAELQWTAARTGAVNTVQAYAGPGASAALLDTRFNNLRRPMLAEVMEQGDEAWDTITSDDFQVTALTGTNMFNENLTTPITPSRLTGSNDGLFITTNVLGATFEASFDTAAYALTRHVLAVEVLMRINLTTGVRRIDPTGSPWSYNYPMWSSGNGPLVTIRWGEAIVDGTAVAWSHWTPTMIRAFASGGTRRVRISCQAGPGYWRIDRLLLRVWSITERRRAVGLGIPSASGLWVPFTMTNPAATGAATVTTGEDLTLMFRRITDYSTDAVANSVLPVRYLRGRALNGDWRRHSQPHNPLTGMPAAGAQLDGIPAVRMLAGGTVTADAMPYHLSRGSDIYGAEVTSQLLTLPGGATAYGQAYVVAGWNPTVGRPVGPLRCEVYRVSDGVRVLGATEVTAGDVDRLPIVAPVNAQDDLGVVYKQIHFRFDDATTLAAGQYEVRLSSPTSTSSRPWYVAALVATAHTTDQTFGGSTDHADGQILIDGQHWALTSSAIPGREYSSDIQAALVEVPPAVTGLGVAIGSLTVHHAEVCDPTANQCAGCSDDTVPFLQLTWSPAPSGSPDIVGYDVDRRDDLSPDWERVAYVAGRLNPTWNDHEARIGVRSRYHVRPVRSDGVTGDWSDEAGATIPAGQVALSFTSNAATGMGCVFPEVWTGNEVVRDWNFREAGDVTYRRFFGRNDEVAFRPMERRGDGFTRTLLLSAMCTVARPTMALFQPLRDLSYAPIPYVCVRDGEGNRWLASIENPEGTNRRADSAGTEVWLTDVTVVQVARTPAIHDTSVAQVDGPAEA